MGNQHSNDDGQCHFVASSLSNLRKSDNHHKKQKPNVDEQFIIDLHRKQTQNGSTCIDLTNEWMVSDQRRLVFISCLGLYKTWSQCPAAMLYSAIFVLPLKRRWIYEPKRYQDELANSIVGELHLQNDKIAFNRFLRLLRWKDHQNLAFWMLDRMPSITTSDPTDYTALVDPFWIHFSDALTTLYDPITQDHYKPFQFNPQWWQLSYHSLHDVSPDKILAELYYLTGKFKAIQEIICESNPLSLNPITAYNPFKPLQWKAQKNSFVYTKKAKVDHFGFVAFRDGCFPDIDEEVEESEDGGGVWMISTEYDENDLNESTPQID
eukprot:60725_1